MQRTRAPVLRQLRDLHDAPRPRRAPRTYAWILEDPDLAPPPRKEVPLTAWG